MTPPRLLHARSSQNKELRRQTPYVLIPLLRATRATQYTIALVQKDRAAPDPRLRSPLRARLYTMLESPDIWLSQEGHLYTSRGVADEHELVDHMLDTLLIDKGPRDDEGAREQQEVEQEEGNTEDCLWS